MTDTSRTPGIVIFVAILNFISTAVCMLFAVLSLIGLLFGGTFGITDYLTKQINQYGAPPNLSLGMNLLFVLFFLVALTFLLSFLSLGIGLLKGRRLAWYFQVAMCALGLFGFPVGTIINTVILVLFFQPAIRDYFKV